MSYPEWEKFFARVSRCSEKLMEQELGIKAEDVVSRREYIEAVRLYFRCYYQLLADISNRAFDKMISETAKPLEALAGELSERDFRYAVKFHDPRDVMKHREAILGFNRAFLKEVDEALSSADSRLVSRMFLLSFVNNMAFQTLLVSGKPLLDTLSVADDLLDLGAEWVTALVSLCLEEAVVRKKLRELGYKPKPKEEFHALVKELMKRLAASGERPQMDVPLADGFRNVRNLVAHDPAMWNPTKDEVNEIVRHTLALSKALFGDSVNQS